MREDKDLRILFKNEIPNSIYGDDANLQVYYAAERLKEIGAIASILPATDRTGPRNTLLLIFAIDQTYFAYRPTWGIYRLSPEGVRQLGLKLLDGKSKANTPGLETLPH